MTATDTLLTTVPSLVNGKWDHHGADLHPVFNPATGEAIAQVPYASVAETNRAVESAHAAFP